MRTIQMKTTISSLLLVPCILVSVAVSSFAAEDWQASLTISSGNATSRLTFGQHPDATDDVDGLYDVPALLSGQLQAAFVNDEATLWRDIRAIGSGTLPEWRIDIAATTGKTIILSWNREKLPENAKLTLIELDSGERIDMSRVSTYFIDMDQGELIIEANDY